MTSYGLAQKVNGFLKLVLSSFSVLGQIKTWEEFLKS